MGKYTLHFMYIYIGKCRGISIQKKTSENHRQIGRIFQCFNVNKYANEIEKKVFLKRLQCRFRVRIKNKCYYEVVFGDKSFSYYYITAVEHYTMRTKNNNNNNRAIPGVVVSLLYRIDER